VHSFGVIWIRISDPGSLGSWFIKGTDESTLVMDSLIPLMSYDPGDLGSLILIYITPRECTVRLQRADQLQIHVQSNAFQMYIK